MIGSFICSDGKVYTLGNKGRELVYGFYVDARTGLLCWSDNKPWWRNRGKSKRDAQKADRVRLSATTCYVKLNGIWYFVEYKIFEESVDCDQLNQPLQSHSIPEISEAPLLLLRKRQLNRKELKATKLKNDQPLARNSVK